MFVFSTGRLGVLVCTALLGSGCVVVRDSAPDCGAHEFDCAPAGRSAERARPAARPDQAGAAPTAAGTSELTQEQIQRLQQLVDELRTELDRLRQALEAQRR